MSLNMIRTINAPLRSHRKYLQTRLLSTVSKPIGLLDQQKQYNHNDTQREVDHHAKLAADWWNENGQMRALHAFNGIRVPFIRDGLVARGNVDPKLIGTSRVLEQQKILEVGCGVGLLTEQLARLGATVTGIDLGEKVITAAREHLANHSPELGNNIDYIVTPIEAHADGRCGEYDAVVLSEVIEHVSDKPKMLTSCVETLKPGGSIFITTPNKTAPMWIAGVLVAEYVLNIVPKGTHHWDKFISPLDLQRILETLNCNVVLLNGSMYDPLLNKWHWVNSTCMCYALQAIKTE